MFAPVRSYILAIRSHSLILVSVDTVLYRVQFFCHVFDVSMKYWMQWRWKKLSETLKIQIQEKDVRKKAPDINSMMSGHGANPIFFNKKDKDWTSGTLVNPPPLYVR